MGSDIKYSKMNGDALQATCNGVEVAVISREFHGPHAMFRITMNADGYSHIYRTPKRAKQTVEARVKVAQERSEVWD